MNKTWLAVEVQYFKFIGQIPCNSHEYDTCNTSRSRGRGGRSRCPWWISSTVRLKTEVRHQGHNQLPAHLAMSEGAAGVQVKEQTVSVTDAGSGRAMPHWCPCCLPIEPGAWRPGAKETTLPAPVCSISARYLTLGRSMKSSSPTANHAWGDDLLISVWFLHLTLIEIHTASLAWLSCPLDTDLSQQAQRSESITDKKKTTHTPSQTSVGQDYSQNG